MQPPKPAAGHPAPDDAVEAGDLRHEPVQHRRAHLEVVTKARVAAREGCRHRVTVAGAEGGDELVDPSVLGDDVTGAASHHRVLDLRDVVGPRTSQRPDEPCRLLAGRGALAVLAGGKRAALPGVDHDHLDVEWDRDRLHVERRAVDPQRVPGHAGGAGQLVHDPARHPRGPVLGPLAQSGQRHGRSREVERQRHRHLERRRGRQARSDGQVGGDLADEALLRPHLRDDPGDVARPRRRDRGRILDVERNDRALGLLRRAQLDPVAAPLPRHRRAPVDGHRQYQPAGVVGVVADQVHPTGRPRAGHGRSCPMASVARSRSERSHGARIAMLIWSAPAST